MCTRVRSLLDRIISNGLRTLDLVSKIEEDLQASLASDAVDALTTDHTGDADGPSTAELDATTSPFLPVSFMPRTPCPPRP